MLPKLAGYAHLYVTESQLKVIEGPPNPDKDVGSGIRFDLGPAAGAALNSMSRRSSGKRMKFSELNPGRGRISSHTACAISPVLLAQHRAAV